MKDNYAKTYRICMTRGHEGGNHFALVNHILLFYKRILKFNSWIHALKEMSATFTFYLHFIYILFTSEIHYRPLRKKLERIYSRKIITKTIACK